MDISLYDAPQLLRAPGTKHLSTMLWKTPLTFSQLQNKTTVEIKEIAKSLDNVTENFDWNKETVTDDFLYVETPTSEKIVTPNKALDLSVIPRGWKDYKAALLQGHFEIGERHNAMMVIAATCKGLGYDQDMTRALCLSADEKHCSRTGDKPIQDLDNNILDSVFSEFWEGGQYTVKNNIWLKKYCERIGISTKDADSPYMRIGEVFDIFKDYAVNFENNLIRTGIPSIDENVFFLTSTHNGILGQPGAGKTSLALQWLENASRNGIHSDFYSLDMGPPIIAGKMMQRELGCDFRQAMDIVKRNPDQFQKAWFNIEERFKNVNITFRAGVTVEHIKQNIIQRQEETGNKVKLLIIDYLECLQGPYSDSTANTAFISQQLKDLANELQLCSVLLLQTQKHSTSDISDPLLSMKQIKGSSVIEQACSVVMTLWREGYNPKTVGEDKYISFAAVKNRFGSLWSDDYQWNGQKGLIYELSDEGRDSLEDFKKRKAEAKAAEKAESSSNWQ